MNSIKLNHKRPTKNIIGPNPIRTKNNTSLPFDDPIRTGDASDEEMQNALSFAQADFIEDLDEEVAQGGNNFSGGQKQRLSIARAIIAGHDFYLFDDCFSALDMNTEAKVKKNLKRLEGSSILIVSQRISTIMDADEILVMDNGEIIDKGTHSSLIDSCSIYREIVNTQIDQMEAFYDYA